MQITQEKMGEDYFYMVDVNGRNLARAINNYSEVFTNVSIFAAQPGYDFQPGYVRKINLYERGEMILF